MIHAGILSNARNAFDVGKLDRLVIETEAKTVTRQIQYDLRYAGSAQWNSLVVLGKILCAQHGVDVVLLKQVKTLSEIFATLALKFVRQELAKDWCNEEFVRTSSVRREICSIKNQIGHSCLGDCSRLGH